jgi:hypothetical protein
LRRKAEGKEKWNDPETPWNSQMESLMPNMTEDQLVRTVERLRDDLLELRSELRKKYANRQRQVTSENLKSRAARIAEAWLVDISQRTMVNETIPSDYRANLAIHFQRILGFSERASKRSRYETEIKAILEGYKQKLLIPLKQLTHVEESDNAEPHRGTIVPQAQTSPLKASLNGFPLTAFVGHSFDPKDGNVVECVTQCLDALGIQWVSGQKPKADRISNKIKQLIDGQLFFIGVFTCRYKIEAKREWMPSLWIVDEKAYAVGKGKKLILFREKGLSSIGGIQGDYEYIEFSRDRLQDITIELLSMFEFLVKGLRP